MADKPYLQRVIERQIEKLDSGIWGCPLHPDADSIRGLKDHISRLESEINLAQVRLEVLEGHKATLVKDMQALGYAEEI